MVFKKVKKLKSFGKMKYEEVIEVLEGMTFDKAIKKMRNDTDLIWTYTELKDYVAYDLLVYDKLERAISILKVINESFSEYYFYDTDYGERGLELPIGIKNMEELISVL